MRKAVLYKNASATKNIRNAGEVLYLNLKTFNKRFNGLIVRSFEMPNAPYSKLIYCKV